MARVWTRGITRSRARDVTAAGTMTAGARRVLRRVFDSARNFPDRAAHRRRHSDVLERLSRARTLRQILVVCYGNVCRSPYLEAVLQRSLTDLVVRSAGFVGSDRPAPDLAVTIGSQRGVDLSRHRSRPITQSAVGQADVVLVMDRDQAGYLLRMFRLDPAKIVIAGDLDPRFNGTRGIPDPWKRGAEMFEASFDRLDRCAATLIDLVQRCVRVEADARPERTA